MIIIIYAATHYNEIIINFLIIFTSADSRFCYGLMQLSSLTELDLSGNSIPKEMQVNLQVSPIAFKFVIIQQK